MYQHFPRFWKKLHIHTTLLTGKWHLKIAILMSPMASTWLMVTALYSQQRFGAKMSNSISIRCFNGMSCQHVILPNKPGMLLRSCYFPAVLQMCNPILWQPKAVVAIRLVVWQVIELTRHATADGRTKKCV